MADKPSSCPNRVARLGPDHLRPASSSDDLGGGDPASWGYQVVMQSNEGFPDKADLLTRKVNEFEGQHRFGGGTDYDCDPHVMDILAGAGTGDASEAKRSTRCCLRVRRRRQRRRRWRPSTMVQHVS